MTKALLRRRDDGLLEIRAPGVGRWREGPTMGSLVQAGRRLGRLEVLGQLRPVEAPPEATGVVVELGGDGDDKRRPVGYDDLLVVLDPAIGVDAAREAAKAKEAEEGTWFVAPSAGRYYSRPSPDKPAFVEPGTVVREGDPVGVLEVMKTFTRLRYEGDGLPSEAKVVAILAEDGDDIARGQRLLSLEPVE